MKSLSAGLMVLSLVAFVGCGGGDKGTAGGPGETSKENASKKDKNKDETFTLSVPGSETLKQGESKEVKVTIDRSKNFDQDVTIKFKQLPKGVSVDPENPVIKHGDKDTHFTLKAADDAAVGNEFDVSVNGVPKTGPESNNTMKIKVEKK